MVEQIDEILAEQIKGTPLENRGLRILQNDVGVTVWVGLDHYDGIDSVTDPEIKAAVRRAVETWEKQAVQNK
jgi:phage baseplate assembly protein W